MTKRTKVIAATCADGRVEVIRPQSWWIGLFPDEDTAIAACIAKDLPADAVSYEVIAEAEIPPPSDRAFRDAWAVAGGKVDTDMTKAREIHRGRIRAERDRLLQAKDIEYQRADERGDTNEKARIAAEKQALRDLPATFDLSGAKTEAELEALWPAELSKREG